MRFRTGMEPGGFLQSDTLKADDSKITTALSNHVDQAALRGRVEACVVLLHIGIKEESMMKDTAGFTPTQIATVRSVGKRKERLKDLADIQGTTDLHEGPWTWESGQTSSLTRTITYTKAATKLVKAFKVTKEQTYVRANGKEFAVFVSVVTLDVPWGGRSIKTSDGLAVIQAQLNNLGREIKKVNEKVYAAQVGCEKCKGSHYTKYCPLKEEGKTLEEAYYTQFGRPFQGGGYKVTALVYY
ncbi:hypothetical protein Tco_1522266 [Tanacetum coccineum]